MIVAITGHRPEDCEDETVVRAKLREAFEATPGLTTVIVGMASGADLYAGDVALSLGLDVWAAKPWAGHKPRVADRELYARVLNGASRVVCVDEGESYKGPWQYHKRNEWMVDHADELIAYWSGKESGGTYACRNYALNNDVPVRDIYG